ncbi:MAG: hypothetical protein V4480_00880 [Patescibacteria group bacterium]
MQIEPSPPAEGNAPGAPEEQARKPAGTLWEPVFGDNRSFDELMHGTPAALRTQ